MKQIAVLATKALVLSMGFAAMVGYQLLVAYQLCQNSYWPLAATGTVAVVSLFGIFVPMGILSLTVLGGGLFFFSTLCVWGMAAFLLQVPGAFTLYYPLVVGLHSFGAWAIGALMIMLVRTVFDLIDTEVCGQQLVHRRSNSQ